MLLGMNTMALDVMAYTEKKQFYSWTQRCPPKAVWVETPKAELTRIPVQECKKCR